VPVYLYQVERTDGSKGEVVEIERPMDAPDPQGHPETGEPIVRLYTAPHLGTRYTQGRTKRLLDDKNIEDKGFAKYVRDKSTGDYYKAAGVQGPDLIKRESL